MLPQQQVCRHSIVLVFLSVFTLLVLLLLASDGGGVAKKFSTLSLFSFLKIAGQWGSLDPHHSPLYCPGVLESDWRRFRPILALRLVAGIQLRFELLQLLDNWGTFNVKGD